MASREVPYARVPHRPAPVVDWMGWLMSGPGEPEPWRRDPDGLVAAAVTEAWSALDDREKYVLTSLLFEGLSQRQLARQLPWSKTHIVRIRDTALDKMRQSLQQDPNIRRYLGEPDGTDEHPDDLG
jgi:DNA-directed RNA polymerase specialized sigma24 family protein